MFSHLDPNDQPRMVNVGPKKVTHRIARARAVITLPREIIDLLEGDELHTPKGPVFQTAILAGTMAIKRTSDLIPLCHPIPLEDCGIDIQLTEDAAVIECHTEAHYKTGVEMEAITGATVAALTVYDMCKGISREMEIREIVLLEKTGGKDDYHRPSEND